MTDDVINDPVVSESPVTPVLEALYVVTSALESDGPLVREEDPLPKPECRHKTVLGRFPILRGRPRVEEAIESLTLHPWEEGAVPVTATLDQERPKESHDVSGTTSVVGRTQGIP